MLLAAALLVASAVGATAEAPSSDGLAKLGKQRRLQQKCQVANTWTSQGRTYVMAAPGAADCSDIGNGCVATQILDYTACEIAQDACYSVSREPNDEDGSCPQANIGHMSGPETWGGPRGCHVQEGANWQFNENGEEGSAPGHTPVCLLDGSAELDPGAVAAGTAFPCCSDCMDGCGGWPASDECHNEEHSSQMWDAGQMITAGICDCDGRCDEVIPGYQGDGVQKCLRECGNDAILSENARCPRGYTFPTSAEACAEAAAAVGHPLSAEVQEQCDRDPCTSADVEHYAGDPICSALTGENYRVMYVPEGSRTSRQDDGYYKAVCVAGGDVRLNDDCACAGVTDPQGWGGAQCTENEDEGFFWCWAAPGTCSDATPAWQLGQDPSFNYEGTTQACDQMNEEGADCDPMDIYELLIPCMSAMADPMNFCESDCYRALRPWVDQCLSMMDPGVTAMMMPAVQMMMSCPPPPPEGMESAPCCNTCQDGCGGYNSATGDYGATAIAPECLDERHTRVVDGATMGVCDSDGQTPFDGQPCRRDCDPQCLAAGGIERVLMMCDAGGPPEGVGPPDPAFCTNQCIQNVIACKNDPLLANDAIEITSWAWTCDDAADESNTAGDGVCSMAVIANSCEEPPPFSDPNFCDNPCIQEAMDCREDPRLSQSIVGVDCTNIPQQCQDECVDFGPCVPDQGVCMDVENDCCANAAAGEPATCQDGWVPTAQPDSWDGCAETGSNYGCVPEGGAYALNGRSCDDAPPQCRECAPYAVCLAELASVFATCGTEGPCSELTQNIVPTMNSACCQDASDCSESGFPLRCSQACAEIYLPFWQQCGDFLGGAQDLQSVSVMCAAQNPDMESHIAAGFCTLSQTANRKCHGACPHEGGHDREECESQRHCCAWNAGSGGGGH